MQILETKALQGRAYSRSPHCEVCTLVVHPCVYRGFLKVQGV